jgi:hypothetical protein
MRITPPATPPAIGPPWPLEWEGLGSAVEDTLAEDVLAEDVLAEDVLAEDVNTPEAPKIAPGPYSGLSTSNVGVRPQRGAEREHKGDDAHYQRHSIQWHSICFRSGVCCYYGAFLRKPSNKP